MSYDHCIQKCSELVCSIFSSCYKKSRYNTTLLLSFAVVFFILSLANIILAGMFIHKRIRTKNKATDEYIKISAITVLALICRVFWCLFSQYYYRDNLPVETEQVLNAIALTCIYLQQSFYVQSWIQIILILNALKGQKIVKYSFSTIDILISVAAITIIIIRCVNNNTNLYSIFCEIVAGVNIVLGLLFILVGWIFYKKLQIHFKFCSKPIQTFILVSIIFLFITWTRFLTQIWKEISGEYLEQNTFGVLQYFLPDTVSTLVINGMQIQVYIQMSRKKIKDRQGLIEEGSNTYTL
ncbi:Transmembrane_domain-containing protein [Hexamita inflata]|uniref:Transmembrane domain-containing protein n=1 Tax=Hexamita inflata TaxID=28002 RepID=A0AA86UPU8_9EUKA|nr:Transmembrane domain-containing protein [Hexamita inflata]